MDNQDRHFQGMDALKKTHLDENEINATSYELLNSKFDNILLLPFTTLFILPCKP